jgi:hypothetical protein
LKKIILKLIFYYTQALQLFFIDFSVLLFYEYSILFLEKFNNLYDCCNASSFDTTTNYKKPIVRENSISAEYMRNFFTENQIHVGKRVKCIDGLNLTINGNYKLMCFLNTVDTLYKNISRDPKKFLLRENVFLWRSH